MTTIINNQGDGEASAVAGMVVGVIVVIFIVTAFALYGLPYLNRGNAPANSSISISIPTPVSGTEGRSEK